jgi:flagellar hook-associated protein 2
MAATFQAGGLSSGLDTNTIIDKFVQLRSVSLTQLQTTQAGYKTQISTLGDLTSKLAALDAATHALSTGGVLGAKTTSANTAFTAVPGAGAVAGEYTVQVQALAQAAKARSMAFFPDDTVQGGTLALKVQGQTYSVTIPDASTLQEAAAAIRASGAPVSAVVLDDGSYRYLSITSIKSGYPVNGLAADALSVQETTTGSCGMPLGAGIVQAAQNATFTVDGLSFARQTNQVVDAVPGTTLTLRAQGGPAENLSIAFDVDATSAKLKTFVDAYNAVMAVVQGQLAVSPQADRSKLLVGDLSIRTLQSRLQALVSATVGGGANVRTLADLGVKTNQNGSLSIDATTLAGAMARDPAAANALFSTSTTGLGALTTALADSFTRASDGIFTIRTSSLSNKVKEMDAEAIRLQDRLDAYRNLLVAQFTAMEKLVSGLKNSSNYLTAVSNASNNA